MAERHDPGIDATEALKVAPPAGRPAMRGNRSPLALIHTAPRPTTNGSAVGRSLTRPPPEDAS